jgi:hypothetical protein
MAHKTKLENWIEEWRRAGFSENVIAIAISTPFIKDLELYRGKD